MLSGQEYTGGDDVVLEEIHIGKGHRYVGKYLREITFPHHSLVIIIRRADGKVEIPAAPAWWKRVMSWWSAHTRTH